MDNLSFEDLYDLRIRNNMNHDGYDVSLRSRTREHNEAHLFTFKSESYDSDKYKVVWSMCIFFGQAFYPENYKKKEKDDKEANK